MCAPITLEELAELKEALLFLHVSEIKELALKLKLPIDGTKMKLIERIIHFLKNGEIQQSVPMPKISCTEKGRIHSLHLKAPMLKGAYKNDLATRNFFKSIIGDHFHFTVSGIDFLNERWLAGNPPTYEEFVIFWQSAYEQRSKQRPAPKAEWAYINFTQSFLEDNPGASKKAIISAWERARTERLLLVKQIMKKIYENLNF